ncbi:MAG: hypothetical protein Q8936_01840 [Bacillota bacterium]|nr:hypothetical protein [Bacillota bacterium]
MEYKYCLIVSQYYHSRHMFIVKIGENFIEKARKFALELNRYKRSVDDESLENLGDLDPKYCGDTSELRPRYNINDAGDIYFINACYVNKCMWDSWEYREATRRESAGFKKKSVLNDISQHHNYEKVQEIVEKHFEIV